MVVSGVVAGWVLAAGAVFAQPALPPGDTKAAPEASAPPATYVGSQICLPCHKPVAEGWAGTSHGKQLGAADLPETLRGCEACHGPGSAHVGSMGKAPIGMALAKADPATVTALCGKCHLRGAKEPVPAAWAAVDPKHWDRTLHARGSVSCLSCHKLHGGEGKALAQAPAALCVSCHAAVIHKQGEYTHGPVAKGECLTCHTPHGSGPRHNLVPDLSAACRTCHSPETEGFAAAHLSFPVAESDCLSCHDPHSSDRDRKLPAEKGHTPYANRQCDACHVSEASGPSKALKKPVKDLCRTCHPASKIHPVRDAQGRALVQHPPVQQGMCTACHAPHAARERKLLKDRVDYVCFFCHSKTEQATLQPHSHKPVATGNCLLCHGGHVAAEQHLLNKPSIDLCVSCHATQGKFTHPVGVVKGKPVRDPATGETVVCARCHAVHGSVYPSILPAQEEALCRSCHKF